MISDKLLTDQACLLDFQVKKARYLVNGIWVMTDDVLGMGGMIPKNNPIRNYSEFRVMINQTEYLNQTVTKVQLLGDYDIVLVEQEANIILDDPDTAQLAYMMRIELKGA